MIFNGKNLLVISNFADVTDEENAHKNGYEEGYEDGQKAEYDRFWDAYQQDGKRTYYQYGFAGSCWKMDLFKPKYNLDNITNAMNMFYGNQIGGSLTELLNELGFTLKIASNASAVGNMFTNSHFTEISLDLSAMTIQTPSGLFSGCTKLTTLEIALPAYNKIEKHNNWFSGCTALENITLIGEITTNGFDVSDCPLSYESLIGIIEALYDYSDIVTGSWVPKISLGSTNLSKLTDAEKAIATEKGWTLV